ncbi:MAG: protein tyrosine kinase [Mycobacteriaceae bacterium]|nr:protein tyrosine kinase [Mycobacteriaceae bacterium]
MGLIDYARVARRRWLLMLAVVAACVGLAAGYASTRPTLYTASSRVYVSMATGTSVNDAYQGGLAAQQRVLSYVNLAVSATLAERVIRDAGVPLSPDELRGKISATFPPATSLIDIGVTDADPDRARLLADKVVAHLRRMVDELETTVVGAAPAARITVVDTARTPSAPNGPGRSRYLLLGLLAGLAFGAAGALLRDRTDRTLRTTQELDALPDLEVLGTLRPGAPEAEATATGRRIRARILPAADTDTAVLFTAVSKRSHAQVAQAAAQAVSDTGRAVVLVDADTSGHGSSARLPKDPESGLAQLLENPAYPRDAVVSWEAGLGVYPTVPVDGPDLLPLGKADRRTADLLAGERFGELVTVLRREFEVIVVETAPLGRSVDAIGVAGRCDRTVVVVELGATTWTQLRTALTALGRAGVHPAGAVVIPRAGVVERIKRIAAGPRERRGD